MNTAPTGGAAAAETETVASLLHEHAPFFYLVLDARGRVEATNSFTTRLLGREVVGRSLQELVVEFGAVPDAAALAQAPGVTHPLNLATAGGLPETVPCRFHPAGDRILVLGQVDVAEHQKLQRHFIELNNELNVVTRQLQKANAQLQRLNELKNRFVGFAAHDLRRPVGVVLSYTEFLQDEAGPQLSTEHREFLGIIHGRAQAMLRLIEDLLDIAMIEAGRSELRLEAMDLAAIFATAFLTVQPTATARQVNVVTSLDPALPRLELDALKIEQAVVNLLANAVEHTHPGTTVRLEARREGNNVVVSVTDQGPGIEPSLQERLFQPFERGQSEKAGGTESHGLGLAITRRMVEAHRGRVWVESQPGQGATFSFSFPILTPNPRTPGA